MKADAQLLVSCAPCFCLKGAQIAIAGASSWDIFFEKVRRLNFPVLVMLLKRMLEMAKTTSSKWNSLRML